MLNKYISDVSHLRSHHWKYWLDLYDNCGFDCSYCVYRIGDKMGKIVPRLTSGDALRGELSQMDPGILYLGPKADIYQPRDVSTKLTRSTMAVLCELGVPVFTVTRSSLILRDLDILQQMAAHGNIEVSITIASPKENESIEPNTPSVFERIELIAKLKRAGITVSVHMSPIIPYLDSPEELCELMRRCRDAGADCVYACVLGMSNAYADHVGKTVKIHFPDINIKDVYPELVVPDAVYSANTDFIHPLMLTLAQYAETHAIPFACVHLPELDTAERNGGIFRHKVPTVGDICRHINRFGSQQITWPELHSYLRNFPAVDDEILSTIRGFWNEGVLFKNTHFHCIAAGGGEFVYERREAADLKISNMKVTGA